MINRVINFLRSIKKSQLEIKELQENNIRKSNEIIWANIYHDSIRDKKELQNLSLNIGRWAGGYPFFYILNRILSVKKPQSIIEFGLGESSKFISTYLDYFLLETTHLILEQNEDWKTIFEQQFKLNERCKIEVLPLVEKDVKSFKVNSYKNLEEKVSGKFNFYLVDGPFGSSRFSRYDIIRLTEKLESDDDFIILIDDTNRAGEMDTVNELISLLKRKNIDFASGNYCGEKTLTLVVSKQNEYFLSL